MLWVTAPLWYTSKTSAKSWEIIPVTPPISKPRGEGGTILINMKSNKRRKLSGEILGLLAVTLVLALILLQFLGIVARAMIDSFLFMRDIVLTEAQYAQLDDWVFHLSLLVSVAFFIILFLFLLGERLSYIREVLAGIDALRSGQEDYVVPLEGSNELTQLAEAVNYLSRTQREVKEQERVLNEEKEQFIRALSHDIRTPLTSIMAYSELLTGANTVDPQEQTRYLELIQHKAGQIKDMTDILLDGSKRNPEYFEDARLLIEQLTAEFEEMLEDGFSIEASLDCPAFPGTFDVQELRRIFDNLVSNVQKYADPDRPVKISISLEGVQLLIRQENAVRERIAPADGYQIGLRSIQRIAQNYAGQVDVQKDDAAFAITITLSVI